MKLKTEGVAVESTSGKAPVEVTIKAPNFQTAEFEIVGTSPLVVHKFSTKARQQIMATQEKGDQAKKIYPGPQQARKN